MKIIVRLISLFSSEYLCTLFSISCTSAVLFECLAPWEKIRCELATSNEKEPMKTVVWSGCCLVASVQNKTNTKCVWCPTMSQPTKIIMIIKIIKINIINTIITTTVTATTNNHDYGHRNNKVAAA